MTELIEEIFGILAESDKNEVAVKVALTSLT